MVPPLYLMATKTRFLVTGSDVSWFRNPWISCEFLWNSWCRSWISGTGWTQAGPEVERETIGCLNMRGVKRIFWTWYFACRCVHVFSVSSCSSRLVTAGYPQMLEAHSIVLNCQLIQLPLVSHEFLPVIFEHLDDLDVAIQSPSVASRSSNTTMRTCSGSKRVWSRQEMGQQHLENPWYPPGANPWINMENHHVW